MNQQELYELKPGSLLKSHSNVTFPTCDKNPWSIAFLQSNGKQVLVPDDNHVLFLKKASINGAAVLYNDQIIVMYANNLEIAKL